MITADIVDLLNDIFSESVRLVFLLAVILLAIFLGKKLRDRKDSQTASDNLDNSTKVDDDVKDDEKDNTNE